LLSEELAPSLAQAESKMPPVWIADPLDGTTNFSLGLHVWGVTIAHIVAGRPETAALYFPLIDELYTAGRGQGACLNGKPIAVSSPQSGARLAFFACCSRTHQRYQVSVPYKTRILGSAAYNLCAVARGAAVLSFEAAPKVWDIAGGSLLVEEAGGTVAALHGEPAFPLIAGTDYGLLDLPTLAAATPEILAKAKTQIISKA
jgi:myo-inositol-1(or 4)-monophosphatase